ncbi:LuxR C-terminal-related transcriptional regulator [Streptomyces anandii]|uniref:LuxR C-terminal-related transcriptional regulator n=1 Tax=Streptomyces anandii TaxID=285454 RepID=UPI0036FA0518
MYEPGAVSGAGDGGPGPAARDVDPLGDPFLRTRLAVPARPTTFLRRDRLAGHLDQALDTPLTMVNGGAGAGKTVLVADWADRLERPVAWLTVDASDQAPGVFWAYLLQALRACGVREVEQAGHPADPMSVDHTLLARLAAALNARDEPVIVVVDEYDRVSAPEITEQLGFVLQHAGPGMHLILVTRTEPLLPLHRYRAEGTLTEIREAELAFTPEEAATLLELHGLRLTEDAARALVERTRGWAAGLRLCALAAQQSSDPESYLKEFEAGQSTIADFLLAEVLKRQPAKTQDLLLRVSVLDRFCPDLANALAGRQDAGPILAGLHRANAFVEHLGHSWYRLHPLFAEILAAHLRVRFPGLEAELHRRAAAWLLTCGPLPETLAHGAAAGDWEFTARALVDDLAIGQFFTGPRAEVRTQPRSADLGELFSRMAPDATGPEARLVRAARALSDHDVDRARAQLRRVRQELDADRPRGAAARLSCALLEVLAAGLTGAPGRAEHAAQTVWELQREVAPELLDRHPELAALLQAHLGSARLWAGRFEDARAALRTAAAGSGGASTALPREESLSRLALMDYLDGWPGPAERKALAALTDAERFSLSEPAGPGLGHLVLAAVAVDRDELDEAQALLDRATAAQPEPCDPVTAAGLVIARARLQLARGQIRAALRTAESAVPAAVASPWAEDHTALVVSAAHLAEGAPETAAKVLRDAAERRGACAVGAARAQLAAGNAEAALDLLANLPATDAGGPAVTVRAALVRAQAADQAGDGATARRLATQAVAEARRERLRRPVLEAGPWLRRLLGADPLAGTYGAYGAYGHRSAAPRAPGATHQPATTHLPLGTRQPAATRPPVAEQPAPLVVEELSGREQDVLQRLAQMMSTEEIAADLFVSVNTVKTHLKSVYRKLGVNRRGEAVRRARDLGLL